MAVSAPQSSNTPVVHQPTADRARGDNLSWGRV